MKANAKQLIEKIQSKLPRLMELREGQEVLLDEVYTRIIGYDCALFNNNRIRYQDDNIPFETDDIITLGIKPTLADVLEAFAEHSPKIELFGGNDLELKYGTKDYITWNLSEPIENQSDELINNLLKLC